MATGMPLHGSTKPSRKWIQRRIDQLDPEADYAEIYRLAIMYGTSNFLRNWAFALNMPHFAIPRRTAEAVYREGRGKLLRFREDRVDDTSGHVFVWGEHGPDSPYSLASIDIINKLHAHWAREYPDAFAHAEDYVYVACFEATNMHSAMRTLGLPGLPEKQKIAAHRFWYGIASHMTVDTDRTITEAAHIPDDFDGMVRFCEGYENRDWGDNEPGHRLTRTVLDQFAERWFPRWLRPLGEAMVTVFYSPGMLRVHRIPEPKPVWRGLARTVMKARFLYSRFLQADPAESTPDRRRRMAAEGLCPYSAVDVAVHRAVRRDHGDMPDVDSACPHEPVPLRRTPRADVVDQPVV
ncbi:hypothetical protein ACFWPQ_48040 [Streptomyces sp. NPDC058464]|uniref:hypothetical protein n=1 Tax=Streptomyces sp. NPDC058464 TaxID=3346511 RepID=UPI0036622C59